MARKRTAAAAAFVPPSGDKALDDLFAPLRAAAIARILKAVGKSTENGGQLAIGTDAEIQLATDIFEAYVATPILLDPHEGSKATERLQRVKSIREAVEKQAALISADPYLSKAIGKAEGIKPPPILELHIELLTLETQLSSLADKWQRKADLPPALKGRRPSEPEWLAGVALPLVYERGYRLRPARSRTAPIAGATFPVPARTQTAEVYCTPSRISRFTALSPSSCFRSQMLLSSKLRYSRWSGWSIFQALRTLLTRQTSSK